MKELDVENIRRDEASDFFVLPQLDSIYRNCGEKLKSLVASKLSNSKYGPKHPIEMEVPKSSRVYAKATSVVGPNYFRPGSVLLPEDRIVYHFIAQEAEQVIEAAIDRSVVFSNLPMPKKGEGFAPSGQQWVALKAALEKEIKAGKYTIALKCDISQYFFSINQHELINQLEHQGFRPEMVKFTERFLSGLTLDRSSRGIIQGLHASDLMGNGYLTAIDEFISDLGLVHFRYVDDMYVLFVSIDDLKNFFPRFVKRLRDYDLSLNESKTFIIGPVKLLQEETELDKAIAAAKLEATEKLTDYEAVEVEIGPYGDTVTDILETPPDEKEVELTATIAIFQKLDDFKGEERHRAESFCLRFFRRAGDPIAIDYVVKRWLRHPEQAREYVFYLNRFAADTKYSSVIDGMIEDAGDSMIEYQWAWAALLIRRFKVISEKLLLRVSTMQKDGAQSDVVRSLLTYAVCRHGTPQRKKEVRDGYGSAPLLVQLAIIHCGKNFTSGERSALMKTAEAHGEIQALMCEAFKAEQKAAA